MADPSRTGGVAARQLSAAAERAFSVRRHFPRADGPRGLADALVGLHASRHSGPYVTLFGRAPTARGEDMRRPPTSGGLVVLRCMRGTLHALSPSTAGLAYQAVGAQRRAAAEAAVRRAGLIGRRLAYARGVASDVLEAGGAPDGRTWQRAVARRTTVTPAEARAVTRYLWDVGEALAYDASVSMHRPRRAFVPATAVADFRPADTGEDSAAIALARRYVRAYGPVSRGDLRWWTGWGYRRTERVLARLRSELEPVRIEGFVEGMVAHPDDLAEAAAAPPLEADTRVLAYEDPAIKAYYATRVRYLAGCDPQRVFWHAGEARATVWHNGIVAATWWWASAEAELRWEPTRRLARAEAAATDEALAGMACRIRAERDNEPDAHRARGPSGSR